MNSVVQDKKCCWICGTEQNLHDHHIFHGTSNRKNSEKYGMKVWLCATHHNMSDYSAHFNKEIDASLKEYAQTAFEEIWGTREDFRAIFGKSWL